MRPPKIHELSIPFRPTRSRQIQGVTSCSVFYSCNNLPFFATKNIINDHDHVLHDMLKERIMARDRDTLWQAVGPHGAIIKAKRVLRSLCVRRVKAALWEAMRKQGFDTDGRHTLDRTPGIRGTLSLHVLKASASLPREQLENEMKTILNYVQTRPGQISPSKRPQVLSPQTRPLIASSPKRNDQ